MSCLLDETNIIQHHMEKQRQVISELFQCLQPLSFKVETASLRDLCHEKVIIDCLTNIELQLDSLFELRRKTRELLDMVSNRR
jgi:hypothetical protein